jgi:hypothetical protein
MWPVDQEKISKSLKHFHNQVMMLNQIPEMNCMKDVTQIAKCARYLPSSEKMAYNLSMFTDCEFEPLSHQKARILKQTDETFPHQDCTLNERLGL